MKSYKARGIVLHTVKYGESSVVLYMLTDLLGRQTYMVQGVRGGKSKGNKAAILQPMFILDYIGLESPKMEMHRMKDTRTAVTLRSLPFDIRKSTISLFMAEVLYRLVREVEPNSPLFEFVHSSVETLDALEEGVANFHLWFLVRLSAYLGFHPGNEYTPGCRFDMQDGLFTLASPPHALVLGREGASVMNDFLSAEVSDLATMKLDRARRSDFLASMLDYLGLHFDMAHNIRSVQILKDVF